MNRLQSLTLSLLLVAGLAAPSRASEPAAPAWTANAATYFAKSISHGAHRGGRALWPENTLVAYTECAKRWPDILLEGDVHTTTDGALVMLHDQTVDRTTDGKGAIEDMTLAQVKALDAGYHFTPDDGATFPWRGKGVTIPTLDEVLAACPDHRFLVEMKGGVGVMEAMMKAIRDAKAEGRFLVASFNPVLIQRLRVAAPDILTCFDSTSAMLMFTTLRTGDWAAYQPPSVLLTLSPNLEARFAVTPEEIGKVRAKGIRYQYHTINKVDEMKALLTRGADGLLTDYPDRLAEILTATK